MAEEGAPDELAVLTNEIAALTKALAGIQSAEPTSKICTSVLSAMKEAESSDSFLVHEGPKDANKFHTTASGGSGADSGCCVVA